MGPGQELPLASASGPFNGTTTNLFPHDAKVLIYATFSDQKTYLSWVHLYKRPWFGVSTSACHAVMKAPRHLTKMSDPKFGILDHFRRMDFGRF